MDWANGMYMRINHNWSLQEVAYHQTGKTSPLLIVGALSYISEIHITDLSDAHPDQEPGRVEVGRCCSLAGDIKVHIYGEHDYRAVTTSPLMPLVDNYRDYVTPSPKQAIKIGNDVWIGTGAMILTGVTIGDGAVIGAMAVVAKDVPPYAVVAGNPARLIRYRFSETQIEALQHIAWWNWPLQKIKENAALLISRDIDAFINKHLTAS